MFQINRLALKNYRNIVSLDISIDRKNVVLIGPNGSGKTNIMESVSIFNSGRGVKGDLLEDIVKNSENKSELSLSLNTDNLTNSFYQSISLFDNKASRSMKINGSECKSPKSFEEYLNVIWVTPEITLLYLMSSSDRRRFFDRLISIFNKSHSKSIYRYEYYMRERSKLLKSNKYNESWLIALERQMVDWGYQIMIGRQSFIDELNNHMDYSYLNNTSENLLPIIKLFLYEGEGPCIGNGNYCNDFSKMLFDSRDKDSRAGGASFGPHKCDFLGEFGEDKKLIKQCSTGQQKIFITTFMFRFIEMIQRDENRTDGIIFILDDVVAHLDYAHRLMLFEDICNNNHSNRIQTWMSGTEYANFTPIIDCASFFQVINGEIQPISY